MPPQVPHLEVKLISLNPHLQTESGSKTDAIDEKIVSTSQGLTKHLELESSQSSSKLFSLQPSKVELTNVTNEVRNYNNYLQTSTNALAGG